MEPVVCFPAYVLARPFTGSHEVQTINEWLASYGTMLEPYSVEYNNGRLALRTAGKVDLRSYKMIGPGGYVVITLEGVRLVSSELFNLLTITGPTLAARTPAEAVAQRSSNPPSNPPRGRLGGVPG